MKTLSEIKTNIISFYSSIQNKITDFTVGSVINDIFYSISASLEDIYTEIDSVVQQAYISTATGAYLDKLIYGTFQLPRSPATRNVGYVVVYSDSPISNPEATQAQLTYATYDYTSGVFISGLQNATKFIGYNTQGESGIVYALIQPKNTSSYNTTLQTINLDGRNVQFLLLPVASVLTGTQVEVFEGGISSYPNPALGLSGVLNTSNPGSIFFSTSQPISGAPFYSRYTDITKYTPSTSSFSVVNAYNFSNSGYIEIGHDLSENAIVGMYTEYPSGNLSYPGTTLQAGLVFEYIQATTSSITLKQPIDNTSHIVPTLTITSGGNLLTLTLDSFTYLGDTYKNNYDGTFTNQTSTVISTLGTWIAGATGTGGFIANGLVVQQRADQINNALIFDPDSVLTADYRLINSAIISGASDTDTDAEYRQALRTYLASLAKATNTALEAGTLEVAGVTFAKTLPPNLSPRGSAIILASDDNGTLSKDLQTAIKKYLKDDWKAAGTNVIVESPTLLKINTTMNVTLDSTASQTAATQSIQSAIEAYLKTKIPGDSIRYSDVLQQITAINGILNVYNLILSKELTNTTYSLYKADYDEAVLERAAGTKVVTISDTNNFTSSDNGKIIVLPTSSNASTTGGATYKLSTLPTSDTSGVGILYSAVNANSYEVLLLSTPVMYNNDAVVLYNLYQALVVNGLPTAAAFFSTLTGNDPNAVANSTHLSTSTPDFYYFLSYIYSEPLIQDTTTTYPINPTTIPYNQISDYTASPVEIFRANSITIGTTSTVLVGITYV